MIFKVTNCRTERELRATKNELDREQMDITFVQKVRIEIMDEIVRHGKL